MDSFLAELNNRLKFLDSYGPPKLDAGIEIAWSTLHTVRDSCFLVSDGVMDAGRRRSRIFVETLEERYKDALATKVTLEQKVLEGVRLMEGLLSDFESRAYAMRDSGLGKSAYDLIEDGRRRVDEGLERVQEVVDEGMDMARRAAGSIESAIESALEIARERGLLKYHEIPGPWRVNEHIISGYRFHANKIDCVKSALTLSNEWFNIWSHAIGLLIVLSIAFYSYPNTISFSLSTKTDVFIAGVFFFAACKCLVCSVMWHTFNSIAEKDLMERFACVDYTGISLLVAASIITTEHTAFYCEPYSRWFWMLTTGILGIGGTILPWHPFFNRADMAWVRVAFYVCLSATGGLPVIQLTMTRGFSWALYFYMPIMRSLFVYIAGAIMYASKVPERWWPGMFDYVGGSHNIWHLAVLGGILFHYIAMKSFFENAFARRELQCTVY